MKTRRFATAALSLSLAFMGAPALGGDTTFTYQGSLKDAGAPAAGAHNMVFRLYSASSGGSLIGTINAGSVSVDDGVFSVDLDFGANAFNNLDRWLEIQIDGVTLTPRQPINRAPYAIQTRGIFVNDEGKVGLGGTLTSELLTLRDENPNILMLSQGNDFGPEITMRNTASGLISTHGRIVFDDGLPLASIGYSKSLFGTDGLIFNDSVGLTLKIAEGGNIGIGTGDPLYPLHVIGQIRSDGPTGGVLEAVNPNNDSASVTLSWLNDVARLRIGGVGAGSNGGLDIQRTSNVSLMRILHNGNVGIGTTNPTARLVVNGTARVNVLEVVGADLAEKFPTAHAQAPEPGTVLEIDPENPGLLRIATSPYSRLVAGVVSGANGLPAGTIMGNLPGLENGTPIALSGRVWVLCDASDAPINAGDFLTSSGTPGHAMRASDPELTAGSVIGKAMTGLDQGETGMVLVLVSLQ